jgi:hypothetical protein
MCSKFLPTVSKPANTNTVQHPTPHQQYEIPTIPAVGISRVLLPQSNIMAAFVNRHRNIIAAFVHGKGRYLFDVPSGL